jgi:hypothetical protein
MVMTPDPRFCFDCDRPLDLDAVDDGDGRLRFCPTCQAVRDAYQAALGDVCVGGPAPRFEGAVALGVSLPGWPTDIALLALHIWDRFAELLTVEMPGLDPPRHARAFPGTERGERPPHKWVITTDVGSTHHGGLGGGGTHGTDTLFAWHATIAPSLPPDSSRLEVLARAPEATARLTIDLTGRAAPRARATNTRDATAAGYADCPSCGPPPVAPAADDPGNASGFELDWAMEPPPEPQPDMLAVTDSRRLCAECAAARQRVFAAIMPTRVVPERVIALGAEIGDLFGSRIVMPSLVVWPTWFDLTVTGESSGPWAQVLGSPHRAARWTATDDRGHDYVGTISGSHSGLGLCTHNLTFAPALDPDATSLIVAFPASFDGRRARATIDLHP